MRVVFWQNIISPHQAGFMRALAERGHDVLVVAAEGMSGGRARLGWSPPDVSPATVLLAPSPAAVTELIQDSGPDTIHCVAGARVIPLGRAVMETCAKLGRRAGMIGESADPRGLAGLARWGKYAIEARHGGRRFGFVLGMGETGVRWYQRCGYPKERVFPFAYTSELSAGRQQTADPAGPTRFLFVGQLIHRKGVDLLIKALSGVPNAELQVIGGGPEQERLVELVRHRGMAEHTLWMGTMERDAIAETVAQADVLVLPSRFDGWGAVVNEALSLGTPVICSSAAGASDVLRHEWLGSVFRTEDVSGLQHAVVSWTQRGRCTPIERGRIQDWASRITGAAVAAYLEQVLEHVYAGRPRPMAPWRT